MMWLEYLFDRIGGPEPFRKIAKDEANAWSDPAVISMGQRVVELVKANGFVKGSAHHGRQRRPGPALHR